VELEEEHIAISDFIVAAFDPVVAGFAGMGDGAALDEIVAVDGFGLDEAFFEVGVDGAGGAGGGGAGTDGPGADFLVVEREEGAQAEESIGAVDQGLDPRFRDLQFLEIIGGFIRREIGEIAFELGANGHRVAAVMGLSVITGAGDVRVGVERGEVALPDVGGEEGWLGGEQRCRSGQFPFFAGEWEGDGRAAGVEVEFEFVEDEVFGQGMFIAAFEFAAEFLTASAQRFEVGEDEFGGDDLDIAQGVDVTVDVMNVGVLEAADDLDDGIHFADVAEELVAEAFALRGAANQAGDIDELDGGRDLGLDLGHGGQPGQARVWGLRGLCGRRARRSLTRGTE
jgi:hypothetical protein